MGVKSFEVILEVLTKVIYTFLSEEMQDTAGGKQDQMQEMLESAIRGKARDETRKAGCGLGYHGPHLPL